MAAIGDGQALDLMKPLNASVADSTWAKMSRVGGAGSQEGVAEHLSIAWRHATEGAELVGAREQACRAAVATHLGLGSAIAVLL